MPFLTALALRPTRPRTLLARTGPGLRPKARRLVPLLGVLFALWANAPLNAQSPQPNILYIVVDDLNDYVWAGDNHPDDLPNLAALAADGVRYDACYATSPLCGPSRVSFLTGKDPDWTGVYRNEYVKFFRKYFFPRPVTTIMQHLRESGYYTVGINKVFHNVNKAQYDNDFDITESDPLLRQQSWNEFYRVKDQSYATVEPLQQFPGTGYRWGRVLDEHEDRLGDHRGVSIAIDIMASYAGNAADYGGRPLMLTMGIVKPHVPHIVPAKYYPPQYEPNILSASAINFRTPGNPGGWPLPDYGAEEAQDILDGMHPAAEVMSIQNGDHQNAAESFALAYASSTALSPRGLRNTLMANANMAYMASARYVDAQIGRMLHALDSLGLDDNTVVVFHSDHGFSQGEHRHWAKNTLWETDGRVPLIIRDPREPGGQVVSTPVSLLDIFPTMCDLAGIGLPVVDGDPDYLDGRSIWPLRNSPNGGRAAHLAVAWTAHPSLACGVQRSVYEKDWHLLQLDVRPSGDCSGPADTVELLFNLAEDPGEWKDLSSDFASKAIYAFLHARLEEEKPTDQWNLRIQGSPGVLKADDTLALTLQLFDAEGTPVSPPAGTAFVWQLAAFPHGLVSGSSIATPMAQLPLPALADKPFLRVQAYWRENATGAVLGFDTKSLPLDLSAARLGIVGASAGAPSLSASGETQPHRHPACGATQWFDLTGRPIPAAQPGAVSVHGCGQGVWTPPAP